MTTQITMSDEVTRVRIGLFQQPSITTEPSFARHSFSRKWGRR